MIEAQTLFTFRPVWTLCNWV